MALCLAATTVGVLQAQPSPALAAVDSAIAARKHYTSAGAALRAGDVVQAQQMLERAMHAWPSQPAYATSLAHIAARNGRAGLVASALSQLAQLEAGGGLLVDSAMLALASRDTAVAVAHQHLAHALRAHARSELLLRMSDSTMFPEGVAHDPKSGSLFITSIRHRTIVEVTAKGAEREILPRSQRTLGAMMAVRVDPDGAHLWATTNGLATTEGYAVADSSLAALLRVRIADGAVVGRWEPGKGSRHILGDVAVAPNGDVYVSDSYAPMLFRLRKGSNHLDTVSHPFFRSLQGLAITKDGRYMYLADYAHGLLRLNLESGGIILVKHPDTTTALGIDGLVLHGSSLIAIQNGIVPPRVVRFDLDASGTAITAAHTLDRRPDVADEPTNGVLVGNDFVYIANSQWEKYDADGKRLARRALQPPRLLRLPLGAPTPPLW